METQGTEVTCPLSHSQGPKSWPLTLRGVFLKVIALFPRLVLGQDKGNCKKGRGRQRGGVGGHLEEVWGSCVSLVLLATSGDKHKTPVSIDARWGLAFPL